MIEPIIFLSYLVIGAVAGLLAGLLGVGGGLVIVPLLIIVFYQLHFPADTLVQCAVATSLSTIVVTAAVSFYHHYRHKAVIMPLFSQLTVGAVFGAVIGAWLASRMQSHQLKNIFAGFELLVAFHLLSPFRVKVNKNKLGSVSNIAAGVGIGAVSALLGIGGGTMTVPYLMYSGHTIHKAVGTSAALGLPLAIVATLSFVLIVGDSAGLPENNLGYVHIPAFVSIAITSTAFAPLGVRIAHRTSTKKLNRVFALFLLILGIYMLLV